MRAPFQVLVFLFYINDQGAVEFAIFRRADFQDETWQVIAGGGEHTETPLHAAQREAQEEAGISPNCEYSPLDTTSTIPVTKLGDHYWEDGVRTVPEHSFSVRVPDKQITLSAEHTEYRWLSFDDAVNLLKWESNKNALRELNDRLMKVC